MQGRKAYAVAANSTAYNHFTGMECLHVHFLKPARLGFLQGNQIICADDMQPAPAWLEYKFHKSHLIFRWLLSQLAAWISENHDHELGIPPKSCLKWTAGELKAILENNLVPSHCGRCKEQLQMFWCIQREGELNSGRPKAQCFSFNLAGHSFPGNHAL